jgi:hypothetical protein
LGIRRGALDEEVKARRAEQRAQSGPPPLFGHWEVEPWPEEVDTDALLLSLKRRMQRHVILSDEAATVVALWVLFAWAHDTAAVHSPILRVTSPEANSGKTTLLSIVAFLVPRALLCVEISEATLFRGVELWQPTIIVDEADVILVNNEPLRAVVNSGWTRGAVVPRCIGDDKTPHAFPTFCPKALGMKGRKLLDTTLSRCIDIELKRKRAGERLSTSDRSTTPASKSCGGRLCAGRSITPSLKGAEPKMPAGFENRLGDNYRLCWRSPTWPVANGRNGRDRRRKDLRHRRHDVGRHALLAAIRAAFDQTVGGDLSSAELVAKLTAEPDSEWAEWRSGKPITQAQLARLLRPFGVAPCPVRIRDQQVRGYRCQQFVESFERYLPEQN